MRAVMTEEERKERHAAQKKAWNASHPAEMKIYRQRYYQKNKERIKAKQRENYREHPEKYNKTTGWMGTERGKEKRSANMKKYYLLNKVKHDKACKKYAADNAEKMRAYRKAYYLKNKSRLLAYSKNWRQQNPNYYKNDLTAKQSRRLPT